MPGAEHMHFTGLVNRDANNVFQWFPQRDPQAQVLNFLDSNGLLPQRQVLFSSLFAKAHLNWYFRYYIIEILLVVTHL